MTEQAQNALLKTIEEPPEYVVIILIAENASAFLPTILSRCVLLNMKPVSEAVITKYLIDSCKLPDYAAHSCAVFAQGNIGKAVRYAADGDFMELMNNVIRVLRSLDSKRTDELAGVVKHIKEEHFDIDDYLDIMILWYRDVLLYKAVKDNNMLIFRDEVKYIAADAKVRSYENIEKCIKAIEKAKIRLNANVNFDITIELLLITLKEIW
jgi:DNA polymerase III, gamma/tau subunits